MFAEHGLCFPSILGNLNVMFVIIDCQYTLPVNSREAKDIENAVKRQMWDTNERVRGVSIVHINRVDNAYLEREYHEKRAELREQGRNPKELTQVWRRMISM